VFADRADAGRALAQWFLRSPPEGDVVVLALPRGGVPVAAEIAEALHAPMDLMLVRKLGVPFQPELAAGAIASGGVVVYNRDVMAACGLRELDLAGVLARETEELKRREKVYSSGAQAGALTGRTVILVDDGAATGATMRAAVDAVRASGPRAVIVALPTASAEAAVQLKASADSVVVLHVPEPYIAVGAWYHSFPQLTDEEVNALCLRARPA
jgi:putative phosphoribosyl transferase